MKKLNQPLTTLISLVEQYKDDFALPEAEAQLLVSCAQHIATLKKQPDNLRSYARQCADYYRQQRPDDFFITSEGREIFSAIANAYQTIIDSP